MEGACINTYTTHSNIHICSHSALTCRWFMAFLWSGFAISDCDTHIKAACFCCWMPRKVVVWLELELQQRAWRILTYFDNISTASLIWIQSHFYSIFLFLLLWFFFRLYSLLHFICFFVFSTVHCNNAPLVCASVVSLCRNVYPKGGVVCECNVYLYIRSKYSGAKIKCAFNTSTRCKYKVRFFIAATLLSLPPTWMDGDVLFG